MKAICVPSGEYCPSQQNTLTHLVSCFRPVPSGAMENRFPEPASCLANSSFFPSTDQEMRSPMPGRFVSCLTTPVAISTVCTCASGTFAMNAMYWPSGEKTDERTRGMASTCVSLEPSASIVHKPPQSPFENVILVKSADQLPTW